MYNIGKCLLSDLLIQAKMTQQELANKLRVTKQQVNKYCKDEVMMTLPIAINIASILNCNVEDLYELIPVKERDKRR